MSTNLQKVAESIDLRYIGDDKVLAIFNDYKKEKIIFFGVLNALPDEKNIVKKADHFVYANNANYTIENKDYLGEQLTFKKGIFLAKENNFFENIFTNIAEGIEVGIWPNLLTSLNEISELLDIPDEDGLSKTIKGYIGEIVFMYWIIKNYNKEFAKTIFEGYQKKQNKKHDFRIGKANLAIEIKSTSGERMSFIMKTGQQTNNLDEDLYYAFVKYDTCDLDFGFSLKEMLDKIFDTLDISNKRVPNHLLVNSKDNSFDKIGIDLDSIRVVVLPNKKLPGFYKNIDQSVIEDLKYKINIPAYINKDLPNHNNDFEIEDIRRKLGE